MKVISSFLYVCGMLFLYQGYSTGSEVLLDSEWKTNERGLSAYNERNETGKSVSKDILPIKTKTGIEVAAPTEMGLLAPTEIGTLAKTKMGTPVATKLGIPVATKMGTPVATKIGAPVATKIGAPDATKIGAPVAPKIGAPVATKIGAPGTEIEEPTSRQRIRAGIKVSNESGEMKNIRGGIASVEISPKGQNFTTALRESNANKHITNDRGVILTTESSIENVKASCEISSVLVSCPCGSNGSIQEFFVPQCTFEDMHYMTLLCRPCQNACETFRFCETCNEYNCETCPLLRYGEFCEFIQIHHTEATHNISKNSAFSTALTQKSFMKQEMLLIIVVLYFLFFA